MKNLINRWLLFKIFFPAGIFWARLLNNKSRGDRIDRWLIDRNNRWLIDKNNKTIFGANSIKIKNVFLLLSHCLQFYECDHRLIKTIENCAGCGKCVIKEIVKLGNKYNITIKVATGGRLAKRLVTHIKPDIVIAVACERELIEGVSAVYPASVYAISNLRPNGPCINTTVDVSLIDNILRKIL